MTKKLKFLLESVENIVGIGESAGYQRFFLSNNFSFSGVNPFPHNDAFWHPKNL